MSFLEEREKLYEDNVELTKRINAYGKSLEMYSTFDSISILKILSSIVSEIEDVTFSYLEKELNDEISVIYQEGLYDSKKKNFKIDIDILRQLRKCLTIKYEYVHITRLQFYKLDYNRVNIISFADFKEFPYLEEFINEVISYRFDNSIENISYEELERLKNQFLLKKLSKKRDYYVDQIEEINKKLTLSK